MVVEVTDAAVEVAVSLSTVVVAAVVPAVALRGAVVTRTLLVRSS